MKKRRLCTNHYSSSQRYSRTHERFPIRTKNIHDSKGRNLKRVYSKFQENSEPRENTYLKKDAFSSLKSLFDIKKPLNLHKVREITCDYYKPTAIGKNSIKASNTTKSDTCIKTLYIQSDSPRTKLVSHIFKSLRAEQDIKNELETNSELEAEILNSAEKSQQNHQEHLINMADNEDNTLEGEAEADDVQALENVTEDNTEGEEDAIGEDDDLGLPANSPDMTQESDEVAQPTSLSPLTDENMIAELKEMDERCIVLTHEIQQLKREIDELTDKHELSEEDTLIIEEKQRIIVLKVAEFEELTHQLKQIQAEKVEQIVDLDDKIEMIKERKEEGEKKRKQLPKKVLEEDRFNLPRIEYPEDKLPRVIVCGYTEDELPKIVVADSERKGKEKCFEKLTGKLTESLTMQEKLVKENAQLEGGKYKLEEALIEKDTAVESLQRKVCGMQAEMKIMVKENTELSRQLAALNQLVTSSTCCYTCPGVTTSPPSTPLSLPPCSYSSTLPRDDTYCRCKCCFQSQFADTLSPAAETAHASPRLTGGGSRTEDHYFVSNHTLQNSEMCSRGPMAVKAPLPRGACPAQLEDKLTTYNNSTKQLEQQLGSMESEVRNMQLELANVQRERQQLEQQRKLLKCTGPCAPCSCPPPPPPPSTCMTTSPVLTKGPAASAIPPAKVTTQSAPPLCTGPCINAPMGSSTCAQQQLRDLREQYARLQDDYKNKLCEVSCMRTDAEKFKQDIRDAKEEKERMEVKMIDAQERLKILEVEKEQFQGHKEQFVEQEQALMVTKQRFREAQDDLEELRSLIINESAQLEDYRNKYLQAQQQVEEQRRQLELMEMDNARMNENVTLEIGRVKNQFQEKLAELAPLPDILKQTQMKLQETQQMRLVAERNCEDLSRELLGCKDKIQTLQNQLDVLRTEHQALQDEKEHGSGRIEDMERKYSELRHDNEKLKNTLTRLEEYEAQLQKRIDEKMHENTQLSSMLEQVREDSARQVAKTKERCETVRRSMQGQIAEMELQLAQCRATARSAQRDRDEIRQKMQGQINNLNEAFEHAQGRIRSLQGHVNYLKTSYSNIFVGQGDTPTNVSPEVPGAGYDSCDCNY